MSSHSKSQDPQPQSLWKSMVSKLLGPESGAPLKPLSDPNDLDGLDLDLLPPEPPKPATKSAAKSASPAPRPQAVTFDADDDEPAAAAPAAAGDEPAEVFFSDEADAVDEDLQAPPPDALAEERPGDSYWDALSALNASADADEPREAPRGGGRGARSGGGRGDRRSSGGRSGGRQEGSGRRETSRGGSERESSSRRPAPNRDRTAERQAEPPRERTEERKPRTADASGGKRPARPTPVNSELFFDDDFGVGLTEETRAQVEDSEMSTEATLETAETTGESSDRPRRRRGRRGRRGRGGARENAGASLSDAGGAESAAPVSDDDLAGEVDFDTPPPTPAAPRSPARGATPVDFDDAPAGDESGDGFGAGLSGGAPRRPASTQDEPRERSRRGRRGRGTATSRDPQPDAEVTRTPMPAMAEGDTDDAGEAESVEDRRDRYRNIPTWEEAISYLVRPKRRSRDGGRSGGRPSRGPRG